MKKSVFAVLLLSMFANVANADSARFCGLKPGQKIILVSQQHDLNPAPYRIAGADGTALFPNLPAGDWVILHSDARHLVDVEFVIQEGKQTTIGCGK